MSKNKNKKGTTLLEVMAVIGIIGIMASMTVVSMNDARTNASLESAAEEIIAVMREAQNYSLTGKEITTGCGKFRVSRVNGGSYRLRIYETNSETPCSGVNYLYTLNNGVELDSSNWEINFTAPHGDIISTNCLSGGVNWERIRVGRSGKYYTICFNKAGLIKKFPGDNTDCQ